MRGGVGLTRVRGDPHGGEAGDFSDWDEDVFAPYGNPSCPVVSSASR